LLQFIGNESSCVYFFERQLRMGMQVPSDVNEFGFELSCKRFDGAL
jgi:hypothetical protein